MNASSIDALVAERKGLEKRLEEIPREIAELQVRIDELVRPAHLMPTTVHLSKRQRQVLYWLQFSEDILANKEIAQRMNVSTQTVKVHVAALLRKLGRKNRMALRNVRIKGKLLGILLALCVAGPVAAQHSATLICNPSPTADVTYAAYRDGQRLAAGLPGCTYVDTNVEEGAGYAYTMRAVSAEGIESLDSNIAFASIPQTPPESGPQIGDRVRINLFPANVRQTAVQNGFGTLLGVEPVGAEGVVVGGPAVGFPAFSWIQVKFDSCASSIPDCTGWVGSDNLITVDTTPPPPNEDTVIPIEIPAQTITVPPVTVPPIQVPPVVVPARSCTLTLHPEGTHELTCQ